MKKKFTIRGRQIELSREIIERGTQGEEPGKIRRYYVKIAGKHFPIKQVLGLVTGLPPLAFTSMYAYNILVSLGFEVREDKQFI